MSPEELTQRVDAIIAMAEEDEDDEAAHAEEDKLHLDVIRAFCPDWAQAQVARLSKADFCRWFA